MRFLERVAAGALAGALAACSTTTPHAPAAREQGAHELEALEASLASAPAPAGTLRIRLAFPVWADLDLFVTDPAQETVYFANTPSRSGGRLVRDVRCGDRGERVETVVFPEAVPGRYRIGVDHPRRCEGADGAAAPFVVAVDGHGAREVRRGSVPFEVFLPIVLEVDVPGARG